REVCPRSSWTNRVSIPRLSRCVANECRLSCSRDKRHTHTALLLDSGATPKVVQRQLRHACARTTLEIYGHVVGDAHREAVEVAAKLHALGRLSITVN